MFFIPEKLYNSSGRDLRRALFSLKQIFQVKKKKSMLLGPVCALLMELDTDMFLPLTDYRKRSFLGLKCQWGQNITVRVSLPYQIFQTLGSNDYLIKSRFSILTSDFYKEKPTTDIIEVSFSPSFQASFSCPRSPPLCWWLHACVFLCWWWRFRGEVSVFFSANFTYDMLHVSYSSLFNNVGQA